MLKDRMPRLLFEETTNIVLNIFYLSIYFNARFARFKLKTKNNKCKKNVQNVHFYSYK